MKTSQKVGMATVLLMAVTGYGAWSLYKKYNPDFMKDMDRACKRISKDVVKTFFHIESFLFLEKVNYTQTFV